MLLSYSGNCTSYNSEFNIMHCVDFQICVSVISIIHSVVDKKLNDAIF